jgi:hypothetical protein
VVEGSDADEYTRSSRGPSSIQVRPDQIRRLLDAGVAEDEIVRLLVATGSWTSSGAHEIVEFLSGQLVGAAQNVTATADDTDWPGPIEEPGPLVIQ